MLEAANMTLQVCTNTRAAHDDNQEGLHDACRSHDPRQSEEKDDSKDVL